MMYQTRHERTLERQRIRDLKKRGLPIPSKYRRGKKTHFPQGSKNFRQPDLKVETNALKKNTTDDHLVYSDAYFDIDKKTEKLKKHRGIDSYFPKSEYSKEHKKFIEIRGNRVDKAAQQDFDKWLLDHGMQALIERKYHRSVYRDNNPSGADNFYDNYDVLSYSSRYETRAETTARRKHERKWKHVTKYDQKKAKQKNQHMQRMAIRKAEKECRDFLREINTDRRNDNKEEIKSLKALRAKNLKLLAEVREAYNDDSIGSKYVANNHPEYDPVEYLEKRNKELVPHALDNNERFIEIYDELDCIHETTQQMIQYEEKMQKELHNQLKAESERLEKQEEKFQELKNQLQDKLDHLKKLIDRKNQLKQELDKIRADNKNLRQIDDNKQLDKIRSDNLSGKDPFNDMEKFIEALEIEREIKQFSEQHGLQYDNFDDEEEHDADRDATPLQNDMNDDEFGRDVITRQQELTQDPNFNDIMDNEFKLTDEERITEFEKQINQLQPLDKKANSSDWEAHIEKIKSLDEDMSKFAEHKIDECNNLSSQIEKEQSNNALLTKYRNEMKERFSNLTNRIKKKSYGKEIKKIQSECDSKRRKLTHDLLKRKPIRNSKDFNINKIMRRPPITADGSVKERWETFDNYLDQLQEAHDEFNSPKNGLQRLDKYIEYKRGLIHTMRKALYTTFRMFDSTSSQTKLVKDSEELKYYFLKSLRAELGKQLVERLNTIQHNADPSTVNKDPKSYSDAIRDAYDNALQNPDFKERLERCKDLLTGENYTADDFGDMLVNGKESRKVVEDLNIPQLQDKLNATSSNNKLNLSNGAGIDLNTNPPPILHS